MTVRLCADSCSPLQIAETQARRAIELDQAAIKRLLPGFSVTNSALNQWADLGQEQKRKLALTALFNLLQAAATGPFLPVHAGTLHLPNGVASLGAGQGASLVSMLRANKADDPVLVRLIQQAVSVTGKPEKAEVGRHILDYVSTAAQTSIAGAGNNKVEILVPVAQFGLIAMGAGYLGYAAALGAGSDALTLIQSAIVDAQGSRQITDLTQVQETNLKELNRRLTLLNKHVQALRDAKEQLKQQACSTSEQVSGTCPGKVTFQHSRANNGVSFRKLNGEEWMNCGPVVWRLPGDMPLAGWRGMDTHIDQGCTAGANYPESNLVGKLTVGLCAPGEARHCAGIGNLQYLPTVCGCNARVISVQGPVLVDPPQCIWTFDLKAGQSATVVIP